VEQVIETTPALYHRLESTFNRSAVSALRRRLTGDAAARVILDVSHAGLIDDATLAWLTMNLVAIVRRRRKAVALRGLRQHQLRLLMCFGIEIAADGSILPSGPRRSA
jgi:hypothetical protein